jgi:hypothetical protein
MRICDTKLLTLTVDEFLDTESSCISDVLALKKEYYNKSCFKIIVNNKIQRFCIIPNHLVSQTY